MSKPESHKKKKTPSEAKKTVGKSAYKNNGLARWTWTAKKWFAQQKAAGKPMRIPKKGTPEHAHYIAISKEFPGGN